jgi:uncharacterized protein YkwD
MGRVASTLVAAVIGAMGVAGCGATTATDSAAVLLPARSAGAPVAVEPTDGRLGDATAVRAGTLARELSRGGRLDVRRRGGSPRRDGVGAGAACPNPDLAPRADTLPAMAEATLCLLNGERADHGLAPLAPNDKLAAAATAYAQDLVAGSYFSHTGRDGSGLLDRIERTGYLPGDTGWALGENLAWGTGALSVPGSIMRAWMNSPGHRENILNPAYREVGIGIVTGNPAAADGLGATYATEFGAVDRAAEAEPVAKRRDAPRAKRARKRVRRHAKARSARHARPAPRGGKGRGRANRRLRGRVGQVKARIAI